MDCIKDFIIENSAGNLFWKDLQGRYLGCNQNFCEILKVSSPGEIIGKTDREIEIHQQYLNEKYIDKLVEIDQLVIKSGKAKIMEETGLNKDSQLATYLVIKKPLRNEKGEIIGVMGTSIDITVHKEIEELRKERKINQSTIARLKAVTGSIVYQIDLSLGGISWVWSSFQKHITALLRGYQRPIRRKMDHPSLDKSTIDKLEKWLPLIGQRIEKTRFVAQHHIVNVNENRWTTSWGMLSLKPRLISHIIEKAIKDYPLENDEKKLIHCMLENDFEVFGEDNLLIHVIFSLLKNALESVYQAKKGNITLWLEKGKDYHHVHIKDTGEGLSREGRKELFEPFHTTRGKRGTGLGLYFCKSVMQSYYGEVFARGRIHKFAQFTLKFPSKTVFQRMERIRLSREHKITKNEVSSYTPSPN